MHNNLLQLADRIAAHLSTTQAAAISGASSAAAITAAVSVDPNWTEWLQLATFGVGLLSGLGGLFVISLKIVQQRREMRQWARQNPW